MLGVAAATALPSEVFPFRKIFLPAAPRIVDCWGFEGLARSPYPGPLADIEAIQLEVFAKEIPDLIFKNTSFYEMLKNPRRVPVSSRPFHIPLPEKFIWTPNEGQAKAIADKYAEGVDVQAAIDAL